MHITGERLVPAPRERVWHSLADATLLAECVPASRIEPDGEGGLLLSAAGGSGSGDGDPAPVLPAPVLAQPSIRERFSTMGWRIDPAGPGSQIVLIRLAEEGVFTRLHYEVSLADADGADATIRARNLQARIDQALERFIHAIAGPGEIGAGGIAGAVQAATQPSAQPSASMRAASGSGSPSPSAILGLLNPSVIGGVLFLIVLLFMAGLL